MKHSLRTNPKCLVGNYPWEKYYWKRSTPDISYEEEYWGHTIDPDEKKRNIIDEWDEQVENFRHIISFLSSYNSGKILDVGCGPGFLLSGLDNNWEKFGIDISEKATNICKKYARVKTGDLISAEYRDDYFDVITMIHVIEHLHEPLKYIGAISNILKVDGLFIIETPDFDSACARRFGENYRMLHDPGHISLFSALSLIKLLEDNNFEIMYIEYPFFETKYFSKENLLRMFDTTKVSPPFCGNHVTIYALNKT